MLSALFLISSWFMSLQQEWTWSIHPEAGFKVLSPISLIHKTQQFPGEFQEIEYHQYNGGSVTDSILPMAFVIDHYKVPLPADSTDHLYFTEFFQATIDQLMGSVDGTLVYMDQLSHSDREVCVWKATYLNGKGVIRGNLIITGDKYYGLQVFGLAKHKPNEVMTKFIESFRILQDSKS